MNELITLAQYRATLDDSGFAAGAERIKSKSAEVSGAVDRITESTTRATAATAVHAGGFDQMMARLNPLVAEANRYAAQLDQINRLQAAGYTTGAQHQILLDNLAGKYRDLSGANDNATKALGGFNSLLGPGRELLGAFGVALSIGGMVEFAKSIFESTAQLDNQAKTLGISTDALQAFHAASVLSGAGADIGDAAIRRFTRSLGDAQAGTKLQVDAFHELGIVGEDLFGDTAGILPKAARSLLEMSNKAEQARVETELFGKAGQDVNQVLEKWADPEIIGHMNQMGLTIDRELVHRAADADKAWNTFWLHFKVDAAEALLRNPAGTNLNAPGLSWFMTPDQLFAASHPFSPSDADRQGIAANAAAQHDRAGRAGIPFRPGYPYGPISSSIDVTAGAFGPDPTSALADYIGKQQLALQLAKETAEQRQVDAELIAAANAQLKDLGDNGKTVLSSMQQVRQVLGEQTASLIASNQQATQLAEKFQKFIDQAPAVLAAEAGKGLDAQIRETSFEQLYGMTPQQKENADKASKEMQRQQEQAARDAESYWNRMFDNTFRSGQNFFTDLFSTGKVSLKSFLDDFERMFATMLSDLAMKAILKPIIMPIFEGIAGSIGVGPGMGIGSMAMSGMGGLGGLFGSSDPMAASYGAYGSVGAFMNKPLYGLGGLFGGSGGPASFGLGDILGGAGIGMGLGSLFGGMTGGANGGIATGIGGALGGIAGSIFGGPLGAAIGGALGGAIGGLIDGKPSNYTAYANFGSDYSLTSGLAGDKPNSATSQLAQQAGAAIAAAAKQLEAAGITLQSGVSQLQIGSRDQSRLVTSTGIVNIGAAGDAGAAASGALSYLLQGAHAADAEVQKIIDSYRTAGKLSGDFATQLIADITAMQQKAAQLDAFEKSTADSVLRFTQPVMAGWKELMDAQDARLKQAAALGAEVGDVQRVNYLEQEAYLAQLNDAQRSALTGMIGLANSLAVTVANAQSAALAAVTQQITLSGQFASAMRSASTQYQNAVEGLSRTQRGFLVGPLSALSPMDQYGSSRSALDQLFAQSQTGDAGALNNLSGAATTFLQQSLNVHGATSQYGQDFSYVQNLLSQGQKTASASADAANQLADLADQQIKILNDISGELKGPSPDRDLLQKQLDQLGGISSSAQKVVDGLNAQLAQAAQQNRSLSDIAVTVPSGLDQLTNTVALGTNLTVGSVFQSGLNGSSFDITGVRSALDDFIDALTRQTNAIQKLTTDITGISVADVVAPSLSAASAPSAGYAVDTTYASALTSSITAAYNLILQTTSQPAGRADVTATRDATVQSLTHILSDQMITKDELNELSATIAKLSNTIDTSNGSTAKSITDLKSAVTQLQRFLTLAA